MMTRMPEKTLRRSVVALLASMLWATGSLPGWADTPLGGSSIDAGRASLGGRAMYYDPLDADGNTWSGGAQLRFFLSPALALEGAVDYRQDEFNQGATRVDTYPVQASLLAFLMPDKRITPFILGGAGWYFTHVEGPGDQDETENRFGLHAGGGLMVFLNKHWSIDGTYRYVWVEEIQSHDASLLDKDYNDDGQMVTIALNLHF